MLCKPQVRKADNRPNFSDLHKSFLEASRSVSGEIFQSFRSIEDDRTMFSVCRYPSACRFLKYGAFKVRPSISQYLQRSTVSNNYNFHQCLCHSAGFLISHWNGFNELCEIVHDGQYEYIASSASWVGTSNIYAQFLEWFSAGYHL